MRTRRGIPLLVAVLLFPVVATCASSPEQVLLRGQPTRYLLCNMPASAPLPETKEVGNFLPKDLESGGSEVAFPFLSQHSDTEFTFREANRDSVRVDLTSPAGTVNFRRKARLVIDLSRCTPTQLGDTAWHIWRFPDGGGEGEQLQTRIRGGRATADIDHNSYYIMAD